MSSFLERIATYKDVAHLLLKYGASDELKESGLGAEFKVDEEPVPSDEATEFVKDLEALGPTFVKIGQLLSTRADILPPSWLKALQRLQDNVEPFPFSDVQKIVEEELGVSVSKLFDTFDEEPLASASLGQVHRASLRGSGRELAVKIQRPDIRSHVLSELEAIGKVAEFLQKRTSFGKRYEVSRMAVQFHESIMRELNYREEAANLDRLGKLLDNSDELIVPEPLQDLSTDKVLVMDFVPGVKVTDLSGVVMNDIDGSRLADILFAAYLKQVLVEGFFHADPHPGNILMTPDHKLALIDLGMVGTIPEKLRSDLLLLLVAVAEGKSEEAARIAIGIGEPMEHFDEGKCRADIIDVVNQRQGADVSDVEVGSLVVEVTQACGENGVRIPRELYMLGKMLLNLDMVGKALDPEFNPDEAIREYSAELTQKSIIEEITPGSILGLVTDLKEMVGETPGRFNELLDKVSKNQIRIGVDAIDEVELLKGFHRVANRITVGLIISALIIGAAMLMNIESKFTIFGYPGLAMIFFLIAAVAGLILVIRIIASEIRHKE